MLPTREPGVCREHRFSRGKSRPAPSPCSRQTFNNSTGNKLQTPNLTATQFPVSDGASYPGLAVSPSGT